jgi:hypothetical protein
LGKIRLGVKKENEGVSYPSPTDYFVCPDEVKKVFGEKPKELRIMFPTENSEQWASQYLRCYSASRGLVCRGDGEMALSRISPKPGENVLPVGMEEIICNPGMCGYYKKGQCRRVMNLQFLLPDCPGFGVYQLDTTSFHSMKNINSALTFIRGVCQRVSMIPLSLQLVEQEVQPEGWCKTAYVLNLTCPHSLAEVQKYAQIPPGQALLLPPPDSEAPDDLFPEDVLKQNPQSKTLQHDDELIHLWDKAKRMVWQIDMQEYQIAHYFAKYHHLEAGLKDFGSAMPPAKFTVENLTDFIKDIERHTQFS